MYEGHQEIPVASSYIYREKEVKGSGGILWNTWVHPFCNNYFLHYEVDTIPFCCPEK